MHRGQLQPKNESFQCLLKMSVVHILPQTQTRWQGIPHTRTGSRETSITEAVMYAQNDAYLLRRRSKLRVASVSSKLNIRSKIRRCLSVNDWCTRHVSLNATLRQSGSQCNFCRTAVLCAYRRAIVLRRVVAFCTDCIFCIRLLDTPYSNEFQ